MQKRYHYLLQVPTPSPAMRIACAAKARRYSHAHKQASNALALVSCYSESAAATMQKILIASGFRDVVLSPI